MDSVSEKPPSAADICPPEILDTIFDLLIGPDGQGDVEPAQSWLKACALVRSNWTGPAQRLLFRTVTITNHDYEPRLNVFRSPHIRTFPQELCVSQHCLRSSPSWLESDAVRQFAARCGAHIRRIKMRDFYFDSPQRFSTFVSFFVAVEEVDLSRWSFVAPRVVHDMINQLYVLPSFGPPSTPAPRSLRVLRLSDETCLYGIKSFVAWLNHPTLQDRQHSVELEMNHHSHAKPSDICATLRGFGSKLTKLALPMESDRGWDFDLDDCHPYNYTSNTQLKCLEISPEGYASPTRVALSLSTLEHPLLETITLFLGIRRDTETFADLEKQLEDLLAQFSRMDRLRVVSICLETREMLKFFTRRSAGRRGTPTDRVVKKVAAMREGGLDITFTIVIPLYGMTMSLERFYDKAYAVHVNSANVLPSNEVTVAARYFSKPLATLPST